MIEINNIRNHTVMPEEQFKEFAKLGSDRPGISVVEIPGSGWAIYGAYGVYESPQGQRIFTDLAELHRKIKEWGYKEFRQNGLLADFESELPES